MISIKILDSFQTWNIVQVSQERFHGIFKTVPISHDKHQNYLKIQGVKHLGRKKLDIEASYVFWVMDSLDYLMVRAYGIVVKVYKIKHFHDKHNHDNQL